MSGLLGLSGLASGVDTNGIVDKLMAIERQSLSSITLSKQKVQARQAGLKDIMARVSALKSATADLRSLNLWDKQQTVSTSDSSLVGVTRVGPTQVGSFQVAVQQLARGTQRTFNYTQSNGNSTLTIGGVAINVAGKSTVDQVVSSINSNTSVGVFAANVGGQLVLSSKTTGAGAASDFTVSGSTVVEDTTKTQLGLDAKYTINGSAGTATTNVVTDGLSGAQLTLKAVTVSPVTITASAYGADKDAIKAKLKTFIDAYNGVVQLTRDKVTEPTDHKATTAAGQLKGQLFGDTGLLSMLNGLRSAVGGVVAGNAATSDELADLGISTGKATGGQSTPDSVAGKLVLDEDKLAAALADPAALQRFIGAVSGVSGLAQRVEAAADQYAGSGSLLQMRVTSADSEIRRIDDRYSVAERRINAKETRLREQFAAMEKAMMASQNQGNWLSGQLAALNR